jgi:hypothetical protein
MKRAMIGAGALLLAACLPAQAQAQNAASPAPASSPDYASEASWLCRPGKADDRCVVDLTATVVEPAAPGPVEPFRPAVSPALDCFYVYPTVSLDPGYLSDFAPDRMEFDVVALQLARFGSVCRTFAPLYRQLTLTALRAASGGAPPTGERPAPGVGGYEDVLAAWNWYLRNENNGRGVVLIGHSQGAGLVARLIANEIEGKPVAEQLVSGVILGSTVLVPEGKDSGGTFKTTPLCRSEGQTGCVISYATFRDTLPPPENSRFARGRDGLEAACVNPASLRGGRAVADPYFLTQGFLNGFGGPTPPWTTAGGAIATPFVRVPGLVETECVRSGPFHYLAMSVVADPSDPRTDRVAGEVQRAAGPDLAWGLHLIDVDVAMGDLLRIVRAQASSWARAR